MVLLRIGASCSNVAPIRSKLLKYCSNPEQIAQILLQSGAKTHKKCYIDDNTSFNMI